MTHVTQTNSPGWIKKKFHDFGMGEMFAPLAVDRLEEDDALLSKAVIDLHVLHHYPIINTAGHVMKVVAAADQVTLCDNIVFAVGGVVFNTHDQERTFTIPDNSTTFLRASVDPTCGDLVACSSTQDGTCMTPLARKQACAFTLADGAETDPEGIGGGPSSPTSMRILKAVKGAAGSVPVITLYANDGHAAGRVCPAYPASVGQELPLSCLPWPTVVTEDNRATVAVAAKAGMGGTVSLPEGLGLVLGMETQSGLGHQIYLQTPAWTSGDLPINATWYLRAQVDASGGLVLYVQGGTDTDARPAALKGTPGAATGGGFDSTQVDMLLAKIVTGAAGTAPAGTALANAVSLIAQFDIAGATKAVDSTNVSQLGKTTSINFARTPRCRLIGYRCQTTSTTGETEPIVYLNSTRYVASVASLCSSSDGYYRDMAVSFAVEA
jgi:hypothetical protein